MVLSKKKVDGTTKNLSTITSNTLENLEPTINSNIQSKSNCLHSFEVLNKHVEETFTLKLQNISKHNNPSSSFDESQLPNDEPNLLPNKSTTSSSLLSTWTFSGVDSYFLYTNKSGEPKPSFLGRNSPAGPITINECLSG